jgi:hypothetical protein
MDFGWTLAQSFLIILSFCLHINSLNITRNNHSIEKVIGEKIVEKYSLPGGNLI